LWTEQGYGDAIQLVRYAPLVRERCGKVVVLCNADLAHLFTTARGVDTVVAGNLSSLPSCAAHASVASLIHLLGTTLETIPGNVPYLTADAARVAKFGRQIGETVQLKVGLVWAGNPTHKNNRNRSLGLASFAQLLDVAGVAFFSLQKGESAAELTADGFADRVVDLAPALHDFADSAAAISCLDLVIVVDTAVAHLAGALGKPVWTLIPFAPDWRWLRNGNDSPWYPTMRLYRQPTIGDWKSVLRRIAGDLSARAKQHATSFTDRPRLPPAENGLVAEAVQHINGGRLERAEALLRQVLAGDRSNSLALYYLGLAAGRRGWYKNAESYLRSAIAAAPRFADAHFNLGNALQMQGRLAKAVKSYQRAALLQPEAAAIHHELADTLHRLGRLEQAADSYRRTIVLRPNDTDAHLNLGNVLQAQGRSHEAIGCFRQVLKLDRTSPAAHYNIANALKAQDRLIEAVASYECARDAEPREPRIYNNLGNALHALGRLDEAIAYFRRGLAIDPNSAGIHKNLGISLLLQGDLREGSAEYEWRWKEDELTPLPSVAGPLWNGEPVGDGTILLQAEQGYGDNIQFIRYAPMVRARCGHIIVQCPADVAELFATVAGVDRVITTCTVPADITAHAPTLSLMHRLVTTLETIPADVPYLRPDPARVARLTQCIATTKLKVGLVWAGNSAHHNDRNRSVPLSLLAPLLALDGITFYSLQKDVSRETAVDYDLKRTLVDLGPLLRDYADTAAAIQCLDMVIAVDTAVAHLAGALAKPVWTLIPFAPDWRWMLGRDDSPWYPTMRLYRQTTIHDWNTVIARIVCDLTAVARSTLVVDGATDSPSTSATSMGTRLDRFYMARR
jgi:tetratricopeptide (TPR) repeat protein/ADP-heptose:LPS heptosyltransferase